MLAVILASGIELVLATPNGTHAEKQENVSSIRTMIMIVKSLLLQIRILPNSGS